MIKNIDKTEKKILLIAVIMGMTHLLLVAYAAIYLHIGVPTCQPDLKMFDKSEIRALNPHHYEVHYVAKMWMFDPKTLILPVGSKVDFFLVSVDVNHGFHISNTNINLMAVPGVVNMATHTFTKPGTHHIYCHEYCGYGHQNMVGEIIVSETVETASFGGEEQGSGESALPEPVGLALAGKKVFEEKGCNACHSIDGSTGVAPSFKNIWGRNEELESGETVKVDEAYFIESIKNPPIKIVKGHAPIMPNLGLTDDEINQVMEYANS